MLQFIQGFNLLIFALFTVFYAYQLFYVVAALWHDRKRTPMPEAKKQHKFAAIISARNERAVISELVRSIKMQNYPAELLDVFVVADNCTDDTAEVAEHAGAIVFKRFNRTEVGKGYALDYAFQRIAKEYASAGYEGYFIFDADNLLDRNYVAEMNKVFDSGYRVITSYRNSKNFDSNWISAGSALWFLRESKFLNNSRMILGTNCAVSGTGFLVACDVLRARGGWKYHLLTEDIQFSIDCACEGERVGYCSTAVLYDEQPVTFEQSWNQRLRWSKGFYQVFARYGRKLFRGVVKRRSFSCYDMLMTVAPAMLLTLASVAVNAFLLVSALLSTPVAVGVVRVTLSSILSSFGGFYLTLLFFGAVTVITEWKHINTTAARKVLYTFTFPLFIFTYIPIAIVALFRKIEWKPIAHTISKSIEEFQ
ncbi:glycosyltransferase family 2 protein [Butyricicoccus pullicaecorum]|uniref:glycosyltransferase family 2 protein n=1 Tax=Butyricicoccus pullicaecorum TaxID=501571 RepID=UPI0035213679